MTTKLERATERNEARERLLELLTPGDTIYTVMTHVSRSGMSRSIDLLIGRGREVEKITYLASRAMGDDKGPERIDQKNGGIVVPGYGMDMGFHLVYGLSRTLWPNGYKCIGQRTQRKNGEWQWQCPATDHHNPPYPARDGVMLHKDGGYALNQRWL